MVRADGIHKVYKETSGKELHILKDISVEFKKGEASAIIGPSGAGKSTLLHVLGGIDRPNAGRVFFGDSDLYSLSDRERAVFRNRKIGFVFQFYHLLPEFTALENAIMPALIKGVGYRVKGEDVREKAMNLMEGLGLGDRLYHRPGELSGGEQQRVAIARAVINDPDVLLCDEPTGNLDSKMGEEILKVLLGLNKKKLTTLIIVTHDKEIAKKLDRIIEIKDGRIIV